jgi:hypothetical protein
MAAKPKTKAQMRADAIEKCKDKAGRITPEAVIDAASDPKSILHKEFEWDVSKGHHIYQMDRARELIREARFIITYSTMQLAVPKYISDRYDRNSSYIETDTVKKKSIMAKETMIDEVRRIKGAAERSRALAIQFGFGLDNSFKKILEMVTEIEEDLV